jgi:hypothetical protein
MDHPPSFLGIGPAKTGSTSLRFYLSQHPDLCIPDLLEPSWFATDNPKASDKGVRSAQDYSALFNGCEGLRGEISPAYFHSAMAPEEILRHAPETRLVTVLRNPVDRAHSHFMMEIGRRNEVGRDFLDAALGQDASGRRPVFIEESMYADALGRYTTLFGERLLVCLYDDLLDQPGDMIAKVFRHFRVRDDFAPDLTRRYRTGQGLPRSELIHRLIGPDSVLKNLVRALLPRHARARIYSKVDAANRGGRRVVSPEARALLWPLFAADVQAVSALLGTDLESRWAPGS